MKNTNAIALAMLLLLSFAFAAHAQSSFTSFGALNNWLPIVAIAVLIGMSISGTIYLIGFLLNENGLRARGISEFGQSMAALVFTIMIIAILSFYGSVVSSTIVGGGVGGAISKTCTTYLPYSSVNILQNAQIQIPGGSSVISTPTYSICNLINSAAKKGSSDITPHVDYGLASSYVIIANLTSQAASNLNGFYVYEEEVGFLSSLRGVYGICETGPACLIPLQQASEGRILTVKASYAPFSGFGMLSLMTRPVETQAIFIFYSFTIQLIIILLLLQLWPWLLAAGAILRSISYTRTAGGLLMAIAVTSVIILPIIEMVQFAGLNGSVPLTTIGNQKPLPAFSVNGLILGGDKSIPSDVITYNSMNLNFYVFPSVTDVVNYNGCWPQEVLGGVTPTSSILTEEVRDSLAISTVGVGYAIGFIFGGFLSSTPQSSIYGIGCTSSGAFNTAIAVTNIYGRMSVTGIMLPILDILIYIAAIRNISSLFGGDTSIAGIGKLV